MSSVSVQKSGFVSARRRRNGGKATIEHVARLSEVSRATAARAFSNPELVAEATRAKVIDAACRLDYRPNVLARGLAGGETHTIAVIWSLSSIPVDVVLTQRLAGRLQDQGYLPYICDLPDTAVDARRLIEDFAQRGVDGLIVAEAGTNVVIEAMHGDLRDRFRAVVLETSMPRDTVCDEVVRNRADAFREVAAHFARSGRRHPLLVMSDHSSSYDKINAFRDECHRQSMELLPKAIAVTPHHISHRSGADDINSFLSDLAPDGIFPFDAIMCENDMTALAVRAWLRQRRIRVPEDVALVGFNNSDMSRYLDPPLASVDRQTDETIDAICELLFARLKDPDIPLQRRELPMRFLWRESAAGMPPEKMVI